MVPLQVTKLFQDKNSVRFRVRALYKMNKLFFWGFKRVQIQENTDQSSLIGFVLSLWFKSTFVFFIYDVYPKV